MRILKLPRNNLVCCFFHYYVITLLCFEFTTSMFPSSTMFLQHYDRTTLLRFSVSLPTSLCTFTKITIAFIYFQIEFEWKSWGFGCAVTITCCSCNIHRFWQVPSPKNWRFGLYRLSLPKGFWPSFQYHCVHYKFIPTFQERHWKPTEGRSDVYEARTCLGINQLLQWSLLAYLIHQRLSQ